MHLSLNGLSEEDFLRMNERAVTVLRELHPDKSESDLVHALGQARGLTEPSGHARAVEVASLLLGCE